MAKRPAEPEDGEQAYIKRQKLSAQIETAPVTATETVHSARQLKQLLAFDQDAKRAKQG